MTTQHTKLPWVFFVSANNTVISPKWGQFKLAALDSDNHKIDAQFIVTACNSHYELLEACRMALADESTPGKVAEACCKAIAKAQEKE